MAAENVHPIGPNSCQCWRGDAISRRALIGGASATIMVSAAPAGSAREILSGRAGDLCPKVAGVALSAVFWSNAQDFLVASPARLDRFPGQVAHSLAIAIELSLKSYLLHRGFSDDWNRVHIGHDLRGALRCARRAGLVDFPPNLPLITTLLSPFYLRHAFDDMSPGAVALLHRLGAHTTVQALHNAVGAAVRRHEHFDLLVPGRAET